MNTVGQRLKFNFSEKVALTQEGDQILVWSAPGSGFYPSGEPKVFQARDGGKAVLQSDGGHWWGREKKEAEYCWYAQLWLGDYPYGSWAYCIRVPKNGNPAEVTTIATEINPRGRCESDRWIDECKTWTPS